MATQRERSEATQQRILEAAVRVLVQHGYAAASTTRIVEEAGVSRGAMLHHYPNKAVLMESVLQHVLQVREQAFHDALQNAGGADPVAAVIDAFWDAVGAEEAFVPWLELTVAARTEPRLREVLGKAADDILEVILANFRRLFDLSESPYAEILPSLGIALLQGLAMQDVIHEKPGRSEMVLMVVKWLARGMLVPTPPPKLEDPG